MLKLKKQFLSKVTGMIVVSNMILEGGALASVENKNIDSLQNEIIGQEQIQENQKDEENMSNELINNTEELKENDEELDVSKEQSLSEEKCSQDNDEEDAFVLNSNINDTIQEINNNEVDNLNENRENANIEIENKSVDEDELENKDTINCPEGYDEHDWEKIVIFLNQTNKETNISNADILGITDLNNPESEPFERYITWCDDKDNKKHIQEINFLKYKNAKNLFGELNLEKCEYIEYINIDGTQISSINIAGDKKLTTLNCRNCKLKELDVNDNENLQSLNCYGNNIKELSITGCPNLSHLMFLNSELKTVKISNTKIEKIDISLTSIMRPELMPEKGIELILENNDSLYYIDCDDAVEKLQLKTDKDNSVLTTLYWGTCEIGKSVKMSELNIEGKYINIQKLRALGDNLKSLDFNRLQGMNGISIYNSPIKSLNLSDEAKKKVTGLDIESTDIFSLDLTQFDNLGTVSYVCGNVFNDFKCKKNGINDGYISKFFIINNLKYLDDNKNEYLIKNGGNGLIYFLDNETNSEDNNFKAEYLITPKIQQEYKSLCVYSKKTKNKTTYSLNNKSKEFDITKEQNTMDAPILGEASIYTG